MSIRVISLFFLLKFRLENYIFFKRICIYEFIKINKPVLNWINLFTQAAGSLSPSVHCCTKGMDYVYRDIRNPNTFCPLPGRYKPDKGYTCKYYSNAWADNRGCDILYIFKWNPGTFVGCRRSACNRINYNFADKAGIWWKNTCSDTIAKRPLKNCNFRSLRLSIRF